jgi:hypothetical protein
MLKALWLADGPEDTRWLAKKTLGIQTGTLHELGETQVIVPVRRVWCKGKEASPPKYDCMAHTKRRRPIALKRFS